MAFRDENESLRSRIRVLEAERDALKQENCVLKGVPPFLTKDDAPPIRKGDGGEAPSLAELVRRRRTRETSAAQAQRSAERREVEKLSARLRRRPRRVRTETGPDGAVLHIAPPALRDVLWEQLPWGFAFVLVNPGVFFVMLLALLVGSVWMAIALWVVLLCATHLVVAQLRRSSLRLMLNGAHFALFRGTSTKPVVFGARDELVARTPTPDPSVLHKVRFSDQRNSVEVRHLRAEDVQELERVLQLSA